MSASCKAMGDIEEGTIPHMQKKGHRKQWPGEILPESYPGPSQGTYSTVRR